MLELKEVERKKQEQTGNYKRNGPAWKEQKEKKKTMQRAGRKDEKKKKKKNCKLIAEFL